jgi:lysophospholipase L1-like esterase
VVTGGITHLLRAVRSFLTFLGLGFSLAASVLGADEGSAARRFVAANAPEIVYEGRTQATPAGVVRLGFPGIVIHLRLRGDSLALRADAAMPEEYLDISVDGADPQRLELRKGLGEYPLLAKSAARDHRLEITRRTESWQGECDIVGFVLGSNSALLAPDPLPGRKLMFIGDSATCGEAADFRPGDPVKANKESDANLSYAKLLARRLNAQCHLVTYGGRGVLRDWQGIRKFPLPQEYYELALPDDPTSVWNPRDYVPDAIGICLGVNDFDVGVPDENEFVNAFVQFLQKIHRDAPRAAIFLIDSPILSDEPGKVARRGVLHAFLKEVAAQAGFQNIQVVATSYQPGRPGNTHPTARQHRAIADEIEPEFRRVLRW